MSIDEQLFTLKPGRWYGWQLLPGYVADTPYFSPILLHNVKPKKTGRSIIQLSFINPLYADGCQDFVVDLRVTTRSDSFLVGEIVEKSDAGRKRCAVISKMSFEWLQQLCPETDARNRHEQSERDIQQYLGVVFKNTEVPTF